MEVCVEECPSEMRLIRETEGQKETRQPSGLYKLDSFRDVIGLWQVNITVLLSAYTRLRFRENPLITAFIAVRRNNIDYGKQQCRLLKL